jgi:hypothetical protein
MELLTLVTQLASAFREFVAPRYRPELHYMRGPGPAYARRSTVAEESRLLRRPRGERLVLTCAPNSHRVLQAPAVEQARSLK